MNEPSHLPSIGVFGLGIIGSRATEHIRQAGYPVTTWNRTPKERADSTPDPSALAKEADILALYLKDAPAVRSVFETILPSLGPDQTVLNHATIDLDTTCWLEDQCRQIGCSFLNAPFTGSKVAAANGELVYYAGCDEAAIDRYHDVLAASSKRIVPVGSAIRATVIKLTTNLISASTVQALAEALRINQAFGISADTFEEAVSTNACASVLASMKIPSMADGDFAPHFSLANMLKDARYAIDLASRHDLDTPGIATTAERMQALTDKGLGALDFSALFQQFPPHDA